MMEIYLIEYLIIAIVCFLYYNKKISINACIFICCTTLWFIVGLRHTSLGLVDTEKVYMNHFYSILNGGLSEINLGKDTMFYNITYIFIKIFGNKPHLYLLLMSFPYIFSVGHLIKKYSKNIFLSFIIFTSMQYFEISFTIMRQVIAMSILLFSLNYLKDKKILKFIVIVLIASLFHQMAVIFIFAYPFMHLKPKSRIRLIILGVISFFLIAKFYPSLIWKAANFLFENNNRYSHYASVGNTRTTSLVLFSTCLLFSCLGLFYIKKKKTKNSEELDMDQVLLSLSFLATMFAPGTIIITEFSRIAYFFGIYNVCMVPNAITYEKNKNTRFIINTVLTIVLVVYFIFFLGPGVNIIPYKFYWQN